MHSFGISVVFTLEEEGTRQVARFEGGRLTAFEPHRNGELLEPNLALDDITGRALLDALMRHYHGAEDTRALRRDYDAERARVDKLTDAIADLAATLAEPA
jgi:hypothetical protein